jgi:hypothetical protein
VEGSGHRALDDLLCLLLGALGLVAVDERAALADVCEGDRVLAQLQLAGDAVEGRALEALRAGGDDDVVEAALFDRLLDCRAPFGAAHELVDGDLDDAVEGAGVGGEGIHLNDA